MFDLSGTPQKRKVNNDPFGIMSIEVGPTIKNLPKPLPTVPTRPRGWNHDPVDGENTNLSPTIANALYGLSTPARAFMNLPFNQRASQSGAEIMTGQKFNSAPSTGSKAGDIGADLLGGLMGFGAGGTSNLGKSVYNAGENALGKFLPTLLKKPAQTLGKQALGTVGGSLAYEGANQLTNNDPITAKDFAINAGANVALDLLPLGIGKGLDIRANKAINKQVDNLIPRLKSNPLEDIKNAYRKPSLNDVRQKEYEQIFKNVDMPSTPNNGLRAEKPSQYFGKSQSDVEATFPPREINSFKFSTPEQRAMSELNEGMQTAQNYIGHSDILAAYPPGTSIERAYADIKTNTGVDIPKLTENLLAAQNKTSLTPEKLRLGKVAGVIPDLKPRDTLKPQIELPKVRSADVVPPRLEPRQWTNQEQIQSRTGQFNPLLPKLEPRNIELPSPAKPNISTLKNPLQVAAANIETPSAEINAMTGPEQRVTDFNAQLGGTSDSFRAKIDRNPAKRRKISEVIKGLRTQFVDDLAPLETLEKNITGKLSDASESIYKQGRLFRGSPEKAHEFIQSKLAPVIKEVETSGKSYVDLGDYALAVHARDVNAKGIQSGFTDAEISDIIRKFGTPEMEAARKKLMSVNDELMESLVQSGVIDQGLVTALKEKHPNYMPLFRSFDDDKVEFGAGLSKALANVSSPIRNLKGSERDVMDPIESMIKNVFKSISASDRNSVASKLGRLADLDAEGNFVRRIGNIENTSRLNTVYAMENGKRVHYEVQPDVYKALLNLDKESSNLLIKVLQKPAGMLRAGATLTPEFSLRNPMRDVVQAYITSKSGLNPIVDVPRALFDVVKSKRGAETSFNDFLRQNGGFGNIVSMDRKVHQNVIRDIIAESPGKKFMNVVNGKSLMNVLRTITDVTESATKLAEYNAAIRSGASKSEAAYRARDLMDFGRSGASIREANKVVAFLNANIQGKSKLIRSIKENPVGFTTRSVTAITLPTVGVYLSQKYLANEQQKQTIDDAPDWMRENFWLVPVPMTNQIARIPKPFDLAPIFANIPERALKFIADNDPEAFDGFAKQALASYSIPTMITGLLPFVEGMANYSFFKQGPIIPQREDDLNFPDQYDINTSEVAKAVGKGVNKLTGGEGMFKNFGSPRIVDNTIRGVTGGLGTYATNAIDALAETSGIVDSKNKPARNLSELPVLKAFLASERTSNQSMGDLYDEKDRLTREKGSAKANQQDFVNAIRLKQLEQAAGKIADTTKEMRKIENDKSMDPIKKRDKLNELSRLRNELARKSQK